MLHEKACSVNGRLSWPPSIDGSSVTSTREAVKFSECLQEDLFTLHVVVCTRNWVGRIWSTIWLVLVNF